MPILCRCFLLSLLVFTGSYANALIFQPQSGDNREYATQIQIDFEVQEGIYKSQKASISSIILMSYHVRSVTSTIIKIEAKPLFIEASSNGISGFRFSSTNASKNDEYTALLQGGFIFDIELKSGKILAVEASDQKAWQNFIKYNNEKEIKKLISQQFAMPIITQQLRDEEGAKINLSNFMGMTDVTLIVEKVTDDQVQLCITSQGQQNALARIIVERKTGWPAEITMLSQQIVTENKQLVNMQMALFMKQGRKSLFASPIRAISLEKQWDNNQIFDSQTAIKKLYKKTPLLETEIFPQNTGIFLNDRKELILIYVNNLERRHSVGKFKFNNLTLLDSKGNPLSIELMSANDGNILDYYTIAGYTPFVWGQGKKMLEPIALIKARVDFYPGETNILSLNISATKPQKIKTNGVDLELKPTNEQGVYLLTYTLSKGYWLNPYFIAGVGKDATIDPINPLANIFPWLAPKYASLINQTSIDGKRTFYYKLSLPSKPKQFIFSIIHNSDQVAFSRDLVFIDEHSYEKDIHLPPMHERTSYLMDTNSSNPEELKPKGGKNVHNLQVILPPTLSPYCQLTVLNKPTAYNQPLQWSKVEQSSNNNVAWWQLETTDKVIQYFYGLKVTSQLLCNGYHNWQEITYQHHPTSPWLVDLAKLSKKLPDIKQPISTLYETYRFLNKEGAILLPHLSIPSQQFENEDVFLNRPIEDFLVEGHYIRISGIPVKIEQKIFINKEIKKVWETHFDAITCEQGDIACPN